MTDSQQSPPSDSQEPLPSEQPVPADSPADSPGRLPTGPLKLVVRSRKMLLFTSAGVVLALVAGLVAWLAWPEPARDRAPFEKAVASLADARGVRYTDTTIFGQERDITTTEFGEQFGVTGYPGLDRNEQGVLRVGGKIYTKFQHETGRLGKWKGGDPNDEYHYGNLLEEFPPPSSLSETLASALAAVPDLPAPADPGLPALTVGGVPALAAETPAGTLYVAKNPPYRVLRLEPHGPLSPSRLIPRPGLTSLPELPELPGLPPGLGSGSVGKESRGMDLSLIDDASADQMYDTLADLTRQLTDAVDAGINFSLTSAAKLDCSAAGCKVSASFEGTISSKARERITSSGHVTAKLTVTNVTIDGRPAGGCVSKPTTIPITGNTASGRLSCVDKEAGPVFAAVDREYAARAQQQANACGCKVTLRFSSRGESVIDALAVTRAEVDWLLELQKNEREIGACKTPNSFAPGTPVLLADGSTKPIEDVAIGDRIVATDPETGRTADKSVIATIAGTGNKNLIEITIDSGGKASPSVLVATDGHPFWVADKATWRDAADLQPGDQLRTPDGARVRVIDIVAYQQLATVHNLTIADIHTYYVVAGGTPVLVHNCDEVGLAAAERAGNYFTYPGGATGAVYFKGVGWFPGPLSSGSKNIHPSVVGKPAPGTKPGYDHHLEAQVAAIMRQNPALRHATLYIHFRDPGAKREVCWACDDKLEDMLPKGASLTVVFRMDEGKGIFRSRPYIGNAN